MKHEIFLYFDGELPRTTAQEKGEAIRYKVKRVGNLVKKAPISPIIANLRSKQTERSTSTC